MLGSRNQRQRVIHRHHKNAPEIAAQREQRVDVDLPLCRIAQNQRTLHHQRRIKVDVGNIAVGVKAHNAVRRRGVRHLRRLCRRLRRRILRLRLPRRFDALNLCLYGTNPRVVRVPSLVVLRFQLGIGQVFNVFPVGIKGSIAVAHLAVAFLYFGVTTIQRRIKLIFCSIAAAPLPQVELELRPLRRSETAQMAPKPLAPCLFAFGFAHCLRLKPCPFLLFALAGFAFLTFFALTFLTLAQFPFGAFPRFPLGFLSRFAFRFFAGFPFALLPFRPLSRPTLPFALAHKICHFLLP